VSAAWSGDRGSPSSECDGCRPDRPTLIVAGEDDPITPVADMEDIAVALRPDQVRLERFANAGHGVYRDRPGAFFRVLRDFYSGLKRELGLSRPVCVEPEDTPSGIVQSPHIAAGTCGRTRFLQTFLKLS
jgi:hypothetical protein